VAAGVRPSRPWASASSQGSWWARKVATAAAAARSAASDLPSAAASRPASSGPPASSPAWLLPAPVGDLAVHLQDVRGALRRPGDRDAPATRLGLRIYARWLGQRLQETGRPALRLRAGGREWVEGAGVPAATLAADPFELFGALSGRRSTDQLLALAWYGSPERYLDVLSPYPPPRSPLLE
jgi:hypothetical protein